MATSEQLDYFKHIYAQEMARSDELINRGKLFLSVITLYMGLLGIAADKVVPKLSSSSIVIACYLSGFVSFVIALVLIVMAIGIYNYVYPSDPKSILQEADENWPDNESFFLERMAELAAAFKNNCPINDKRAKYLKWASLLMLTGIIFQAFVLSALVYIQ